MTEWLLFSKIFRDRSPRKVARITKELGFDGVDLLVRDGYTVPTQAIERDLTQAVEEMHKVGLSVSLVTTDINSVDDPLLRHSLSPASAWGSARSGSAGGGTTRSAITPSSGKRHKKRSVRWQK